MKFYKNNKVVVANAMTKRKYVWFAKITLLAFSSSLLLSLFSEIILGKSNLIVALILLVIFMMLNVFSDMLGLSITSCQIEELKKRNLDKRTFDKCLFLIKSSDKVSSILCDVVGDICGILCGVSGTMISYLFVKNIQIASFKIVVGATVSAIIAGLTVLFKAISKNYAVKNASKIVEKIAKFLSFSMFKSKKKKK